MEQTQVGPFLLLEKLGSNRRQQVFRARQTILNREVALKFIRVPPRVPRAAALDKLNYEFSVLKTLRHPHLVKIFGAGVADDQVFIASEFVTGESLAGILSRRGRLAADQVVEYARQIALCLEYLHSQKLIHSKLTPDKILITADNSVRVSDLRLNRPKKRRWDLAKHRDAELAAYLAPEQLTGQATHKSDIYSLGTLMYEMLTGRLPFPPDNIARMTRRKLEDPLEPVATHVLSCPIWLDRLVQQMLAPAPRNRPHSAQAVRLALEEIARIDATRRSALDELSGSFNPLHIHVDKTEARELLKKSLGGQPRETWSKNWLSIVATAALLVFLTSFITYMAWPEPSHVLLERARGALALEQPAEWANARVELEQILKRRLSDSEREEAETLLQQSRRQILLDQSHRQVRHGLQPESVQRFIAAFGNEQQGKLARAYSGYQRLLADGVPDARESYVLDECRQGLRRLELLRGLPESLSDIEKWLNNLDLSATPRRELSLLVEQLDALAEFCAFHDLASDLKEAVSAKLTLGEKELDHVPAEEAANQSLTPPVNSN